MSLIVQISLLWVLAQLIKLPLSLEIASSFRESIRNEDPACINNLSSYIVVDRSVVQQNEVTNGVTTGQESFVKSIQ